jgi:methylated-DNA-[protein]-cysteine S-methyltransferase
MNSYCHFESPIGRLLLTSDGTALTGLYMEPSRKAQSTDGWPHDANAAPLSAALRQLSEYFSGNRRGFDVPLRLQGTAFQQRVWRELTEIPFGETWSYGQLARSRERQQPHLSHRAMSSRHRRRRHVDRIRRRPGAQALAAGA